MSLLDALTKLVDDELAEEGITPELLAMIDLSVAYSPVIPFRGGRLEDAVPVRAWGFVPDENIVGRAFLIWWNFDEFKRIGQTIQ